MANFKIAIPILAAQEGGINRNPNDNAAKNPAPNTNGAHTNKGVTWQTFKDNARELGYEPTSALFLQMPDKIRDEIAKKYYWNPLKLDSVNSNKKAYLLFDFAFNSGTQTAIMQTQKALSISIDGIAGPQFLTAVNQLSEAEFSERISARRVDFIASSGKIHESLKPGLIERVNYLLKKKFLTA